MSQCLGGEELLQQALVKTDLRLPSAAMVDRQGLAWLLLVNVDSIELSAGFARHCLQVRVAYGEAGASEELITNEAPKATNLQTRGYFGTTCAYAWRREIEPVIRFSVKYDKFLARVLGRAVLQVPFCEARPSGWLVWPGSMEQELSLTRGSSGGNEMGRLRVTVEMRGVPRSTLPNGLVGSGLPSKMLLHARKEALQGSVLVIGAAKGDSTDSKVAEGNLAKVVLGALPYVTVEGLNHIEDASDEYAQRVDDSYKVSL